MNKHCRQYESRWKVTGSDQEWRNSEVITAGIDVGSVSSQAVILVDGNLFAYSNLRTGSNSSNSARRALDCVLERTGIKLEDIHYIVGTGYGRANVPFAQETLTEISCHAKGAFYAYGSTMRTILDMGGQDCKVIRCDQTGKVTNFLMNDKCAAGTGRAVEVIAKLLDIPIDRVGDLSLNIDDEPPPLGSSCVIFAKSEALERLDDGWSVAKVLASFLSGLVERVVALLNRVGVENDFCITGGIAKNIGIVKRVERRLGIISIASNLDPQIIGALGAALFAWESASRAKPRATIRKQRQ